MKTIFMMLLMCAALSVGVYYVLSVAMVVAHGASLNVESEKYCRLVYAGVWDDYMDNYAVRCNGDGTVKRQ